MQAADLLSPRKSSWLPRRVRDVSGLGAHRGQSSAVRSNRSENNARLQVRSEAQLSRKSSKRAQTGEPNFNTLKTLDGKEVARVKPFVFKLES
jgi:hypothetical protein